jgi:hypothetical protein
MKKLKSKTAITGGFDLGSVEIPVDELDDTERASLGLGRTAGGEQYHSIDAQDPHTDDSNAWYNQDIDPTLEEMMCSGSTMLVVVCWLLFCGLLGYYFLRFFG